MNQQEINRHASDALCEIAYNLEHEDLKTIGYGDGWWKCVLFHLGKVKGVFEATEWCTEHSWEDANLADLGRALGRTLQDIEKAYTSIRDACPDDHTTFLVYDDDSGWEHGAHNNTFIYSFDYVYLPNDMVERALEFEKKYDDQETLENFNEIVDEMFSDWINQNV